MLPPSTEFSSTIASIPLSFQKFKKIFPLPTAQTITLFQYVKRRPAGPWASDVAAAMVILACNRLSLFLRYIHHLHPDPAVPGPGAAIQQRNQRIHVRNSCFPVFHCLLLFPPHMALMPFGRFLPSPGQRPEIPGGRGGVLRSSNARMIISRAGTAAASWGT